ncbi:MAG: hypothetical protein OXK19_05605, partial [Candidatus Dadabacteria bacterium]|nr:hypothetical protein [Candidatus Dadabacteria bacterium]
RRVAPKALGRFKQRVRELPDLRIKNGAIRRMIDRWLKPSRATKNFAFFSRIDIVTAQEASL